MKWIVFDGWGVIYREPDDVENLLTPFVRRHNPAQTSEQVREAYAQASGGSISARQFWAMLGLGGRYPQIQEELLDSYWIFDEQFVPAAERLMERYSLGLLSNDLSAWSLGLRRRYGIERYFQVAVVSDEARSRKPDRGIYETFLEQAGVPGRECLFIDDRLRNLRGAAGVGMRTCWFDRTGVADEDFQADLRVKSFAEMSAAVERMERACC
jgi:HAD superfamily hydrolase (TIGR01549 family)